MPKITEKRLFVDQMEEDDFERTLKSLLDEAETGLARPNS